MRRSLTYVARIALVGSAMVGCTATPTPSRGAVGSPSLSPTGEAVQSGGAEPLASAPASTANSGERARTLADLGAEYALFTGEPLAPGPIERRQPPASEPAEKFGLVAPGSEVHVLSAAEGFWFAQVHDTVDSNHEGFTAPKTVVFSHKRERILDRGLSTNPVMIGPEIALIALDSPEQCDAVGDTACDPPRRLLRGRPGSELTQVPGVNPLTVDTFGNGDLLVRTMDEKFVTVSGRSVLPVDLGNDEFQGINTFGSIYTVTNSGAVNKRDKVGKIIAKLETGDEFVTAYPFSHVDAAMVIASSGQDHARLIYWDGKKSIDIPYEGRSPRPPILLPDAASFLLQTDSLGGESTNFYWCRVADRSCSVDKSLPHLIHYFFRKATP